MQAQPSLYPTKPDSDKRVPPWILLTLRRSLLLGGAVLTSLAMSDSYNAVVRMEITLEAQAGIIEEMRSPLPNQERIDMLQNRVEVSTIPAFLTVDFWDGVILTFIGFAISGVGSKVKPRVIPAPESVSSGNALHQSG